MQPRPVHFAERSGTLLLCFEDGRVLDRLGEQPGEIVVVEGNPAFLQSGPDGLGIDTALRGVGQRPGGQELRLVRFTTMVPSRRSARTSSSAASVVS